LRLLVTGAGGFVGGHLLELLQRESQQARVFGVVSPRGSLPAVSRTGARLVEADLDDSAAAAAVVAEASPDAIVHLAGQSSVQQSWLDPGGTLRTNVLGVVHLLDAARKAGLRPAVLVVGSAEEYGCVPEAELPIREAQPLRPASPYAVSKVAQGSLALLYGPAGGMRVVLTRTFHHTGPGRGEAFAESSFARQIAEIERGLRPAVIEVGNLDAVRDFTDVRDVVRAYRLLLEKGASGQAYNVCSGHGRRIREVLDILLALSTTKVEVRVDAARLRPADVPAQVGDPSRLRQATGWQPEIPLEQSLADLLEDWRGRVAGAGGRA
jgi:GDP-4-dehydro-6-deoxy-D-mannose reductase